MPTYTNAIGMPWAYLHKCHGHAVGQPDVKV